MLDGGLPVVGGRVTMYSGSGDHRRALLRSGPISTNREGAAALSPRRIPKSFTAVVRGGTVDGERFRGSLRIKVNRYRSPAVLTINPVTTFGAAYRTSPRAFRRRRRCAGSSGTWRSPPSTTS